MRTASLRMRPETCLWTTERQSFISSQVEAGLFDASFTSSRGTIALINKLGEKGIEFFGGVVEYCDGNADIKIAGADVYSAFEQIMGKLPNFRALGINLAETPTFRQPSWLWLIPVLTFLVYFGSMKLTHVNEMVMEVFELTGFVNILTVE